MRINKGYTYFEIGDYSKAIKYFKAAEQGDKAAQFHLGKCYYNLLDYKEAVKWYRKAAEQGLKEAQNALKRLDETF